LINFHLISSFLDKAIPSPSSFDNVSPIPPLLIKGRLGGVRTFPPLIKSCLQLSPYFKRRERGIKKER